jgi:diguanylate cyclase (GGDEF)-like protein
MTKKRSCYFFSHAVVYSILALFLLNIFVLAGGSIFYCRSLNALEEQNLKQRVEVAVEVEQQRIKEILVEYSFWDQGYEKSVQQVDRPWVDKNYGEFLIDTYGFSFTAIGVLGGDVLFSSSAAGAPHIDRKEIRESGVDSFVAQSFASRGLTKEVSGFVCIDDIPYLIAVGPFVDEETEGPRPDNSYVLFGKEIERGYLDSISKRYSLPVLGLVFTPHSEENLVGLSLPSDCPDVFLSFKPPSTEGAMLSLLLPMMLLVGLCTFGLSWFLLIKHNRLRTEYEASLYEMASRDALTGVYSRREFYSRGQQLFAQDQQSKRNHGVLMLDIDYFKAINDEHGHSAGDKNLQICAKIMTSCVRGNDVLGRLGGEEFAVILPEVTAIKTYEIAERIRDHIERLTLAGRDGVIPMTISIGAVHVEEGDTFEGALSSADILLYQAKALGRNHVVTADQFEEPG